MSGKTQSWEPDAETWQPPRYWAPPIQPEALGRVPQAHHPTHIPGLEGFYGFEDMPFARNGYRYTPCIANPGFTKLLYTACEAPPFVAGINANDKSEYVGVNAQGVASTAEGYRSVRANVSMDAGEWYFEVNVVRANEPNNDAHVRLGLSRREASLEAPVGADAYSYGLGDVSGRLVHVSRVSEFMEPFGSGDTIGFHVTLPRAPSDTVAPNIRRDRFPILYKTNLFLELLDYVAIKDMTDLQLPRANLVPKDSEVIPGSKVQVYKNGQLMGTLAENLRETRSPHSHFSRAAKVPPFNDGLGGYLPTLSLYRGGQASFNFGPEFRFAPPPTARPLSERYDEQIADDVVLDVLDEVEQEDLEAHAPTPAPARTFEQANGREPEPDQPFKTLRLATEWTAPAEAASNNSNEPSGQTGDAS